MAKGFLVSEQWDAGEKFLRQLSDKRFPVAVAFWAKEPDSDSWHLYIASDRVESSGLREAYGEAMRAFPEEARPWLDLFSIKLIKADDPVAQAVIQFLEKQRVPADMTHVVAHYGGRLPGRHYGGPLLGGMAVEDVWIYPQIPAKETAS
jgi:hypothetical protein